jgi:hypothetical protein
MLRVKSFLRALSQGMKPWYIIINQNPKYNPWNGNTHPLLSRKCSSWHPLPKNMLTLFREMNESILELYQEKGETVNSVRYSTMMEEKLKPAIHSCHCGHLSKGVPFLHDTV